MKTKTLGEPTGKPKTKKSKPDNSPPDALVTEEAQNYALRNVTRVRREGVREAALALGYACINAIAEAADAQCPYYDSDGNWTDEGMAHALYSMEQETLYGYIHDMLIDLPEKVILQRRLDLGLPRIKLSTES